MSLVTKIDEQLEPVFKKAPPLSESARKSLADFWPWLALIFGVLQLFAAYKLWHLTRIAVTLGSYLGNIYSGHALISNSDKTIIYLGVIVLAVEGAILLMAYPKLKAKQRSGWDLVFLGALLNVAYSVLSIFTYGRGFMSFVFSLIGSAIGFWLLYQVKSQFSSKG